MLHLGRNGNVIERVVLQMQRQDVRLVEHPVHHIPWYRVVHHDRRSGGAPRQVGNPLTLDAAADQVQPDPAVLSVRGNRRGDQRLQTILTWPAMLCAIGAGTGTGSSPAGR